MQVRAAPGAALPGNGHFGDGVAANEGIERQFDGDIEVAGLKRPDVADDLGAVGLDGIGEVVEARPEEQLLLLNEQTIAVDADVLMISDDVKPLAMAGIMGGEESGITLETTELFLESAFFAPKAIAVGSSVDSVTGMN